LLNIVSFRPFPSNEIVEALRHVKGITVIERLDIPLMQSNPFLAEIKAAFADAMAGTPGYPEVKQMPKFYGCAAGLGSRDIRAGDFISVTENMTSQSPRFNFTLGIKHETALPVPFDPDVRSPGSFSMRGHSVGGYGSVTTNKVIATIAGEVFGMDVQAYPKYGSEKKGLPTTYYLTIAKDHIRVHSELENVEFIPLNDVNAFNLENPLTGLTQNGMVFVQSQKTDPAEVWSLFRMGSEGTGCEECPVAGAGYGRYREGSIFAGRFAATHARHRVAWSFPEGDAVPEGTLHQ
jgi:Pyruvate:ferredoxin oxidoreductase and related 2-oxoacid:ferredoxin oxidoreductases, gamma subunit